MSGKGVDARLIDARDPALGQSNLGRGDLPVVVLVSTVAAVPIPIAPPIPRPSNRKMTEEEKKLSIRHVHDEIDLRRSLLRENYREMYTALTKSFLWQECLNPSRKP